MKWDQLIQLFEKHELYPQEIIEMIYAYAHEDKEDQKLTQDLLELLGDEK